MDYFPSIVISMQQTWITAYGIFHVCVFISNIKEIKEKNQTSFEIITDGSNPKGVMISSWYISHRSIENRSEPVMARRHACPHLKKSLSLYLLTSNIISFFKRGYGFTGTAVPGYSPEPINVQPGKMLLRHKFLYLNIFHRFVVLIISRENGEAISDCRSSD